MTERRQVDRPVSLREAFCRFPLGSRDLPVRLPPDGEADEPEQKEDKRGDIHADVARDATFFALEASPRVFRTIVVAARGTSRSRQPAAGIAGRWRIVVRRLRPPPCRHRSGRLGRCGHSFRAGVTFADGLLARMTMGRPVLRTEQSPATETTFDGLLAALVARHTIPPSGLSYEPRP